MYFKQEKWQLAVDDLTSAIKLQQFVQGELRQGQGAPPCTPQIACPLIHARPACTPSAHCLRAQVYLKLTPPQLDAALTDCRLAAALDPGGHFGEGVGPAARPQQGGRIV